MRRTGLKYYRKCCKNQNEIELVRADLQRKGINIDEDTKRYYPFNNLASQIIGFCGSDNQGLGGIESKYDYILNGENSAGKMMLAESFAMALQCEEGKEEACTQCRSCRQAKEHNQPDIIYVTHEKPNIISVDDIRHQLNNDIVIKPYSSKYKIYIIDECHMITSAGWNAFLKGLEDCPEYTIFIFCTTDYSDSCISLFFSCTHFK